MKKQTLLFFVILSAALTAIAQESPVLVRVQNFIVTPSTGPVANVIVKNNSDKPCSGILKAGFPEGWTVTPAEHAINLKPGESKKLPFAIESGSDLKANVYPVKVSIEANGILTSSVQQVVCASSPYYKPEIDGKAKEWNDAIPISFTTKDKSTVVKLYWNREQFCLLVEVEEDNLIGMGKKTAEATGMDAVQITIAPAETVTGTNPSDKSVRYEFLLCDSGRWGKDACFLLLKPGDLLSAASQNRSLKDLEVSDVKVVVKRSGSITTYEAAIPFSMMPDVKPTAGREFYFSLLVHDPDGSGIRDLGQVMNLWDCQRNPLSWCAWENIKWNAENLLDGKIEFGFCSSVH